MTKNESVGRHGSVESSWSSRSGDTIRPYGRAGSLRGTPVTVKTDKTLNSKYVARLAPRCHLQLMQRAAPPRSLAMLQSLDTAPVKATGP